MLPNKLNIRNSTRCEIDAIERLYPEAFPDENLVPLVRDLLSDAEITTSIVAEICSKIVGHAIFTKCGVADPEVEVSLLGPLAVVPEYQQRGIGSAIARSGMCQLKDIGTELICVLGDPVYYKRLGFLPEHRIKPPFRLPDEWEGAWQSYYFGSAATKYAGKLLVPRQWNQPGLWAP